MGTLRGLLGIREMDRVSNERIREVYCVKKGVRNEMISESVLQWLGHIERMGNDDRIVERVCGKSFGRPITEEED